MATLTLISAINAAAAAFFFLAAVYAYRNYKETIEMSDYWLVYLIAAALGTFLSSMVAIEWFDIIPSLLDQAVPILLAATATAFTITAFITLSSLIKPTG